MTHTLPVIGFSLAADIKIDLAALLERRLLVQAGSGGGKSTIIRSFAEELAGKVQQFVIDTEGDLVTLREAGDFVIVGSNGDVPADVKTVKVLARRLMELGASAIFDLSGLNVSGRREYVQHLFDELSYMPRALWHPLVVWLDEGHVFAPQSESAVSGSAVANAASTWRKRGYCLVVATQRLSKLNKDVAAELHNKLIGFTDDVDMKRAADQLGMTTDQARELQDLPPGAFYAKGPSLSRARILVRARDPKTSPPPKGQIRTEAPPAPEKVRAILGKLADLAHEAKEELHSIEDLRRAVSERDREIRALKKGGAERVVEKPVIDQMAIDRAVSAARAQLRKEFLQFAKRAVATAVAIQRVDREFTTYSGDINRYVQGATAEESRAEVQVGNTKIQTGANQPSAKAMGRITQAPARPIAATHSRSTPHNGDGPIGRTPQRMLNAMLLLESIGTSPAPRTLLGGLVGVSPSTGTFRNYLSELRRAGYIEDVSSEAVRLSDAGRVQASDDGLPATRSELHAIWVDKFSGTVARMFSVLLDAYPRNVLRAELARIVGVDHTTGTFRNYLSEMRRTGAVVDVSREAVAASDMLFPEGLN